MLSGERPRGNRFQKQDTGVFGLPVPFGQPAVLRVESCFDVSECALLPWSCWVDVQLCSEVRACGRAVHSPSGSVCLGHSWDGGAAWGWGWRPRRRCYRKCVQHKLWFSFKGSSD